MASSTPLTLFLLLGSSVLFLSSLSPCCAEKVNLSLYYETLCPFCADFIANHLVKLFQNGLISIVDLKLFPWGNAYINNGTFFCQHGPDECFLNTIDACIIAAYPDVHQHFKFVHCIETLVVQKKYKEWRQCFNGTGQSKSLINCYIKGYGTVYEKKYAKETDQLNPPHSYVPWVTVNNQPLMEDYGNFIKHVCDAYKGGPVPKACSSVQVWRRNNSAEHATVTSLVSYTTVQGQNHK